MCATQLIYINLTVDEQDVCVCVSTWKNTNTLT